MGIPPMGSQESTINSHNLSHRSDLVNMNLLNLLLEKEADYKFLDWLCLAQIVYY